MTEPAGESAAAATPGDFKLLKSRSGGANHSYIRLASSVLTGVVIEKAGARRKGGAETGALDFTLNNFILFEIIYLASCFAPPSLPYFWPRSCVRHV